MKVKHSGGVKAMTDEQGIEAIRDMGFASPAFSSPASQFEPAWEVDKGRGLRTMHYTRDFDSRNLVSVMSKAPFPLASKTNARESRRRDEPTNLDGQR